MERRDPVRCVTPGLLTGTSSEFLGRRPIPRALRARPTVFVLGPRVAGKTSVALRLAGSPVAYVDTRQLQDDLVYRVVHKRWRAERVQAPHLVLDGPAWLRNRPAVVDALTDLLRQRAAAGRKTIVVQNDADGSLEQLMDRMEAGSMVVLGLRFPKGARGRLRFARRICEDLGIPLTAARGTQNLDPWDYAVVLRRLRAIAAGAEEDARGEDPTESDEVIAPVAPVRMSQSASLRI